MPVDKELQEANEEEEEDSYVWDNDTQLYIHHRSGFHHDPNAGWYYCSKDGHYYKYENGEYVLLEYDESLVNPPAGENVTCDLSEDDSGKKDSFAQTENGLSVVENESEALLINLKESEPTRCSNNQEPEHPQRPSSWVEDARVKLYLPGYETASGIDSQEYQMLSANGLCLGLCLYSLLYSNESGLRVWNLRREATYCVCCSGDDDAEELEEGEWIPEEDFDPQEDNFDEAALSKEEEMWLAQYGQVTESPEKNLPEIPAVDLWDWKAVYESRKAGNEQVARLVGRLVRRSANLHPSVASGGALFKTAPICETRLHLVRVRTGQVYKLRNPSAKYLGSLSVYDSSNPTKDWGFPDISTTWQNPDTKRKAKKVKRKTDCKPKVELQEEVNVIEERSSSYRDRAAERRNLHGGYGVGPGQKGTMVGLDADEHDTASGEDATAEALEFSFGSGSYARRIMGNMGWKEGETLGKNTKGLVEPIQAVGNTGNVGLGFPQRRRK